MSELRVSAIGTSDAVLLCQSSWTNWHAACVPISRVRVMTDEYGEDGYRIWLSLTEFLEIEHEQTEKAEGKML